MTLSLVRLQGDGISTLGIIEVEDLILFTLEDTKREIKIYGETCIPCGTYEIKLRTEGTKHEEYKEKFSSFHKGMLWLQDVPNFQYILIHIGNTAKDTMGCILVGSEIHNVNYILGSTIAYMNLYKRVIKAFDRGEKVYINIRENEKI